MSKTVLIPAVLAAAVALASQAHADNDQYDQFMISHGIAGSGPGQFSLEYLLQQGNNACAGSQAGRSDSFLIGQLESGQQLGRAQAEDIVYAPPHYLCP